MDNKHIATARRLVSELAARASINNLVMNEDGEAIINYEGHEVYLLADPRIPLIQVHAVVCELPEDDPKLEQLLGTMLELNLFADQLADGWFAYSREMEAVLLNKRIELENTPELGLDQELESYLRIFQSALDTFNLA